MKSINILLIEDNEGDIHLLREAFEESCFNAKLNIVRNGEEAIDFIFKSGDYKEVQMPNLILLDINIPMKNGYEILCKIKSDKRTDKIPVIMLSTSSSPEDKDRALISKANHYITKPTESVGFLELVNQIEKFWTSYCK